MNKNITKYFLILLLALTLSVSYTNVSADMGPKPEMTINVIGIEGEYYLDLLIEYNDRIVGMIDELTEPYISMLPEDEQPFAQMIADFDQLGNYRAYSLSGGIVMSEAAYLHGSLQEDGSYNHDYSYVVPDEFKVIIVTEDGDTFISETINRFYFESYVTWDITTEAESSRNNLTVDTLIGAGSINEEVPWFSFIGGFFIRLIATILIEMSIAWVFFFRLRKTYNIIFLTNVFTQMILNIVLMFFVAKDGLLVAFIFYFLIEILIFFTEAMIYYMMIEEKSKLRRVIYAFTANAVSFLVGIMLLVI